MSITEEFVRFIENLLQKGLSKKDVEYLTRECEDHAMYLDEIEQSFHHKSISTSRNYENNEFLGDAVLKHVTVAYINTRFAERKLSVSVRSSLSQKMYSKSQLSMLAIEIGLVPFIKAAVDISDSVREDVFEAFVGAVTKIVDDVWGLGSGFKCIYNIMKSIWDPKEFSTREEDVIPSKTQVKENVWDNLGWNKKNITIYNTSVGKRVLLEFEAISDKTQLKMYWNTVTKKWEFFDRNSAENHRRENSSDYRVYKISATFTPESALIAWAGDEREQDARKRCFDIALGVYKKIGVFKHLDYPTTQVLFGTALPEQYQVYVRQRIDANETYWKYVVHNGLVQRVAERLPNGPQPIDSITNL